MSKLKSNEKSVACRVDGNKFYSARSFHKALLNYNESLCFAELGSENVGLAFANRSAVYLEMKLFDKCLANIEMAKQNNYPEKIIEILNTREEKCRALMRSATKVSGEIFKLSYKANRRFPFVIENLEVGEDKKYGRYIITNKSLKVGDIVAIEKPFGNVLLAKSDFGDIPEANIFQRCTNCLKDNSLDLIPCPSCCEAMFCSTACLESASKRFHRFECSVMDRLLLSGSVFMALRLFFIGLSTFDGSIEKLEKFVKENENDNPTIFNVDNQSSESEQDKSRLLALLALSRSERSFNLTKHGDILKSHAELSEAWRTHQKFIESYLQRCLQVSDFSFHGIFSGNTKQDENYDRTTIQSNLQQPIGNGAMLFCSLINHSCANNVFRVYFEGKIAVIVCRPIQKGAQLFDSYNTSFINQTKADRQASLFKEFGFMCECEACTKDYPTPPIVKDSKLWKFAKKAEDEMMKLPLNQAHKKFRDCCNFLEQNYLNFPSIELFLLQKCIATFLLRQARPSILFP